MSNLITSSIISKETLLQVENNLVISKNVDWSESEKFGKKDAQIGMTYNVRRPILVNIQENDLAWNGAKSIVSEYSVPLTLGYSMTAPLSFTDTDLAFKVEKFSDRFVKQAAAVIAARVDSKIADAVINCAVPATTAIGGATVTSTGAGWVVGAYGTALTSDTVGLAKQYLLDAACPDDGDLYGVLTPKANREIVGNQFGFFNAQKAISDNYTKGYLGTFAGVEFSTSQSLTTHVNGGVSALTIGAGSAVLSAGWAEFGVLTVTSIGAAVNAGDVFTVAGVYAVNPLTKAVTSNLAQFTVVTAAVSGATTLAISPAPITGGEYQNISTTVASKTASLIGATGTSGQESFIYHKMAIKAASPELVLPKASSMDMAEFERTEVDGLGIRFLRGFDIVNAGGTGGGFVSRLDSIFGIKVVRPEWCVRIRN